MPIRHSLPLDNGQDYNTVLYQKPPSAVTSMIQRPAQLRGLALLGLLLLVLAILVGMILRNLERVDSLGSYVSYWHRIQAANQSMKKALMEHIADQGAIDSSKLLSISRQVHALGKIGGHLDPDTPAKLLLVERSLAGEGGEVAVSEGVKTRLLTAMTLMNAALDSEVSRREDVLVDLNSDTRYEVGLASVTLGAILVFAWLFLRRRILAPLHDLRELLMRLVDEDFRPIDTQRLDPLLLPVFNSYNDMVTQLAGLEEVKRLHAKSLEAEVRAATHTLMEQQRSLSHAERLAAVGELAAGIAHELRNPLAGIQMSCANLRSEVENPDQVERLDLIIGELKRMGRLLTDLLEHGKQAPAPSKAFDLANLVRELISLTRYQIPPQISLRSEISEGLVCQLPECRVRQALLNLVLNAAQAIDSNAGEILIKAQRDGEWLQLTVSDDGPGFSPDLLKGGIRPFATGRSQGTGLGLAVVHRAVRDIGGQLKLANQYPRGACVTLNIPVLAA